MWIKVLAVFYVKTYQMEGNTTRIHQIETEAVKTIFKGTRIETNAMKCSKTKHSRCGQWPYNWTIIVLYVSVFCVILPICCHNCYFSIYYNQKLHIGGASPSAYARKVNDERTIQAEKIFQTRSNIQLSATTDHADMVIGVVTMKRKGEVIDGTEYYPRYLLQTVAGILGETLPDTTRVLVCNVETDPSVHSDAVFLSSFVTVVSRYGNGGVAKPPGHLQDKEREDYIFCLNQSLAFHPRYVLVLEDDALIVPGALDVLDYIISHHGFTAANTIAKVYSPLSLQRDFYTDKPSRIIRNLLELLSTGLLGGSLLRILHILLFERSRESHKLCDKLFVASVICCILAALAVSRPHLLELRRISKQLYIVLEANDCCTQAILYPRDIAKGIIAQFQNGAVPDWYPIDAAIDYLAENLGLRPVSVEPNLFTHIGMYSALHEGENVYLKDFF